MMRSDTTPGGCGPRWPQRQQCHREGVCAVTQHPGASRHLLSSIRVPLTTAALPDASSTPELGPRCSPARRGTSHRQPDGVSSSSQQMWTPLKGHSLPCLPGVGLFRGLLLPAPEKQNENNSLSRTGSPQQGTMAGTALPIARKLITPASSLPIIGSDISACSPETGWEGNLDVFHGLAA